MGDFAGAAAKLAGLAGVLFGWRPAEFWDATPAELSALVSAMNGEAGVLDAVAVETLRGMLEENPDG